jgi:hypothetical protein
MYHVSFSTVFIFLMLSFFPQSTFTQQGDVLSKAELKEAADQAITALKDGYLLVKLTSDRRKIEELERQVTASPSNKKLAKKLANTIAHREEFNEKFKAGLKESYDFSKVLFFYDYDAKKLLAGTREGFFLNEALEVDPTIALETENFLILSEGSAGDSGIDAYIIHDAKMTPLAKPFPYYYRRNDFFKVFFSFLDSKSPKYRDHTKVAKDMNDSFYSFYDRVNRGDI